MLLVWCCQPSESSEALLGVFSDVDRDMCLEHPNHRVARWIRLQGRFEKFPWTFVMLCDTQNTSSFKEREFSGDFHRSAHSSLMMRASNREMVTNCCPLKITYKLYLFFPAHTLTHCVCVMQSCTSLFTSTRNSSH